MVEDRYDAVIVGGGPNGLSAAIALAEQGCSVLVLEASSEVGGGARTKELTLPGFAHDVCSAIHPMAVLSPWFKRLQLEQFGLTWIEPQIALAHPLPNGHVVTLEHSLPATARGLGTDDRHYRDRLSPFVSNEAALFRDLLRPLGWPRHVALFARFGWAGLKSAQRLATEWFETEPARALFAGCAAHSFLPLTVPLSAAIGLSLLVAGHVTGWPFPRSGSQAITNALAACFRKLGGTIEVDRRVVHFGDIPRSRVVLFDTSPRAMARICESELSSDYRNQIGKYRNAPGVFKLDWALDDAIPWSAAACRNAGTVHVGGEFQEIAASEAEVNAGSHPERPFVLVAQQSLFDRTRAPEDKHTAWAYCHVPNGSQRDMTSVIEAQIERFAPGFQERILRRHAMNTALLERYNANYEGGDITGGSNAFPQFFARPRFSVNPYETSNPNLFLCSSSTPPGGGVHGMCGFHAARVVLRKVFGKRLSEDE